MAKKEEDDAKNRPSHSGSVVPEDEELTRWIVKQWSRGEVPERIELWQVQGKNKDIRGEMIFHEDFKPGEKRDPEQANKLANEIIESAQSDCDCLKKPASYQIAVIDRNRRATPLIRRIGPFQPSSRVTAIARVGDAIVDAEDEDSLDSRSIALTHLRTGVEEVRRDKQRNDAVIGDVLMMLVGLIQEQRVESREIRQEQREERARLREAEDRRSQYELMLEEKRLKMGLMRDASRLGRNLLTGIFGDKIPVEETSNGTTNGHVSGNESAPSKPKYGASRERTLINGFLNDCDEAKIDGALFGDFENENGKMVLKQPGIFSVKQFHILVGVSTGNLPPDELDKLVPEWKHEFAVTPEQIKKAIDAGVTDGIGMALMEVMNIRREARAAREAAQGAAQQPETNNAPATT